MVSSARPNGCISGWMPGADVTGTTQYLPYGADQAGLLATASSTDKSLTDQAPSRPQLVFEAIDHYYNNSSTTNSLYSSDDYSGTTTTGTYHHNESSILKDRGILENVILAVAAWESGMSGGGGLNNEIVSKDYGMGAMQISTDVWYDEQAAPEAGTIGA